MSDSIEFNVSLNEPVNFNLEIGNQGPKGDKGDTGSKGDTGDRGEKGDPGTTDYNQLQNKPQLDLYLKKSEANTTTIDLLNKISQNTDSITDVLDEKYIPFVWIPHNEATNQGFWNYKNLRLRITLVKDGEDTEFTPFDINTTSIMLPELNKIGKYQDRVYFKDGKWYLEKNTDTKTFDGSESWTKTSEDNVNIYYLTNSINSTSDYPDGFSTHFKNAKAYPNKTGTFAIRGGGQSIFFNHGTITTIDE